VIVVCGEALIDKIRTSEGTQRVTPGGGPFNTARALARLGVPTAGLAWSFSRWPARWSSSSIASADAG